MLEKQKKNRRRKKKLCHMYFRTNLFNLNLKIPKEVPCTIHNRKVTIEIQAHL